MAGESNDKNSSRSKSLLDSVKSFLISYQVIYSIFS